MRPQFVLLTGLLSLVVASTCVAEEGDKPEYIKLLGETQRMTPAQATALEEQVKADPDNLTLHTKLVLYHSNRRFRSEESYEIHQEQALWIIRHHPASEIAGFPGARLNPVMNGDAFAEAGRLWEDHVKKNGSNTAILRNASGFFFIYDRPRAEAYLLKARALEPNEPEWPERLGQLYKPSVNNPSGDLDHMAARMSLKAFEEAIKKTRDDSRLYLLADTGRVAILAGEPDKARKYAAELVAMKPGPDTASYHGNALHQGNIILGHAALMEGDLEAAQRYLLEAASTPGSQKLNLVGPNMSLALELLKKGKKDNVIEYLTRCRDFWDDPQIDEWTAAIKAGRTPDFGPNLDY